MKGREKVVLFLLSSLLSLNFVSFFRGWLIVRDTMILLFKGQRLFFLAVRNMLVSKLLQDSITYFNNYVL